MKIRSGLKDIFQNTPHPISPKSLKVFLNMAQVHMCDTTISNNTQNLDDNNEVDDIELLGILKLKSILNVEAQMQETSRFTWGSMRERNVNLNDPDDPDTENLDV